MGIRLWADEDTPEHQSRTDHETWREYFLNPTDLGGLFTRTTLLCLVITKFSVVALVVEIILFQPSENAISAWILVFSLTVASVSMFGYSVWSFIRQQKLKSQLPNGSNTHLIKRPIRAVQIAFTDGSELNEYEARVQRTVLGFIASVIIGGIPIEIFLGAWKTYFTLI